MTPVVLIGGLMSGVTGAHLAEFGAAFASGMLLHGSFRICFRWLHLPARAGSITGQVVYALLRGLAVMVLCYIGCALAGDLSTMLRFPTAGLWLQALWSGILIDSMLVVNDHDQHRRRRRAGMSAKVRDLVESVTRVHGTPVPVGAAG